MQDTTWFKLPVKLLQQEELSLSAKVIYSYMLWRYNFFKKDNKQYFESQETVAQVCDVSRKTANEGIQKLCSLGWITAKKSTMQTSTYTVKDVFGVYTKRQQGLPEEQEPF